MRQLLLTSLLATCLSGGLSAQLGHSGVCGTPPVDMDVLEASKAMAKTLELGGKMTTYVPLRFKLAGRDDGTGAASPHRVLDLVRSMNVDFAPVGWQFFLENPDGEPWDYIFDTDFYNDHSASQQRLRDESTREAVTIFVPNTATPANSSGNGVTLGYYSPSLDVLVFKRSEVGSNASTASHEVGHFFSLPHTFRGWDCCSWSGTTTDGCNNPEITSPVTTLVAPCSNSAAVELVTRGAGANCSAAGDRFCDTNADYNFGFGWPNCDYDGGVRDRNGDLLTPDEDNFMGYFLDCNPYQFSDEQKAAMQGNLALGSRSRLRGGSPDVLDTISGPLVYTFPVEEEYTSDFDAVELDWEPVPNAQYYYVEVSERRSFSSLFYSEIITDGRTELTLTDVDADERYFYRIRPFSQISFGALQPTRTFFTGTLSSTSAPAAAVNDLVLSPNPVASGSALGVTVTSDVAFNVTARVLDLTGRTVLEQTAYVGSGETRFELGVDRALPRGTYVLSLTSDRGVSNRKFSVQ